VDAVEVKEIYRYRCW